MGVNNALPFDDLFCLHLSMIVFIDVTSNTLFHIYRHGMCFRFIHFILISTAHALFLTCLPISIYGR
jgi:hypothetical protein